MQGFREISAADKIRETLEEFADVDCCSMEVKEAFGENAEPPF